MLYLRDDIFRLNFMGFCSVSSRELQLTNVYDELQLLRSGSGRLLNVGLHRWDVQQPDGHTVHLQASDQFLELVQRAEAAHKREPTGSEWSGRVFAG